MMKGQKLNIMATETMSLNMEYSYEGNNISQYLAGGSITLRKRYPQSA